MFSARESLLSDIVPWVDYVADDVVLMRDNTPLLMLEVDGLAFETLDDPVINARHTRLEFALRDVAQDGLIFHVLQCRGEADPGLYPAGACLTEFGRLLDQRYRERLFGGRMMWMNRSFLAINLSQRRTLTRFGARLASLFAGDEAEAIEAKVTRIRQIAALLCEQLKDYRPHVLRVEERNGRLFSQQAEALAFALTGFWRPVPLTTSGANAIFSEAVYVGKETIEIRMPHRSAWAAVLSMHDFPYVTEPGMFDRFAQAGYRHTLFQAFRCLPSIDGQGVVLRKQNRMKAAGDRALSQAHELTDAANLIAGGRMMMGEHAFALAVFADEHAGVAEKVRQAWFDLSTGGIKTERESGALPAVLMSMIPGNFDWRGREAAISSRNFAAMTAFHTYPLGERKGPWGGPIACFRTSGGTPFLFHFHTDGVGNALITGMTGSGKTSLIGMLLCQAERAGATIVLWDKDRGLEALIRTLAGRYLALTNVPGLGSGLAPLKRLSNSTEDLAFLSGLIRACIATPEPYDLEPEEDRRLGIALQHVMSLPPAMRSLSAICFFLGTSRKGAGARLEKWCVGGEFGWVIDCERDIVDLDGRIIAFDQSAILDDPTASGAVMATLFHYTGKLVDGRRLLFLLDEVWKALEIPQFQGQIKNGLKTWRKYNSPLLIGTQSVADGLTSPIAHTIKEQCPNQFYFANPHASEAEYGKGGMRLSDTEIDIVRNLPKGTGTFLLRQGDRSIVVTAPLGLEEIRVISGTRNGSDALQLARQRTGDADGMELAAEYIKALEELETA